MPDPQITPERLASALAARLIHDAMGPASGIVSAFDLLADPTAAAMRGDALALAEESARRLVDLLMLCRTIYGGEGASLSSAELAGAAAGMFAGSRADLTLHIQDGASTAASGRIFLGLLQIMASGSTAGGTVLAEHSGGPDRIVIRIEGSGPRMRLPAEVYAGLAGDGPGSARPHRWSAAYLIGAIARTAGGAVQGFAVEGGVSLRAVIRAATA